MSDEWDGLLRSDETILWQGAPKAGLRFDAYKQMSRAAFLFTCAFGLVPLGLAIALGDLPAVWLLFIAGYSAFRLLCGDPWAFYKRRYQFYTLTNRRAFVGTYMHGHKRLDSYSIETMPTVKLVEGKKAGDILFARAPHGPYRLWIFRGYIGFEQIEEVAQVYQLLSTIRSGGQ